MDPTASDARSFPWGRLLLLGVVSLALGLGYAYILSRTQDAGRSGSSDGLAQPPDSKEGYNQVEPFTLTDQDGRTVTRDDLLGHAWIACFVFARCTGPCPRISGNMKALQARIGSQDVRLVTFTVDPEHDTPEVLREYAANLGANPQIWSFLTGTPSDIQALSQKSFLLPIERDSTRPIGESVTHRTVLTVVDKSGRVRGYYDGENEPGLSQALARATFLAHESP